MSKTPSARKRFLGNISLLGIALAGAGLFGQIVTASLDGIVLDPAGAAVPNARVRIVNNSTGAEAKAVTDTEGRYTFPSLPLGGPYSITVGAAGFNTEQRTGIALEVNQAARIDFALHIGATTETITVKGEAPLIEPTTAAMGQVVNSQSIMNLPLNQRIAYSLVFLAPGVTGTVGFAYNSDNFSINGGRPGTTDILVDGIPSSPNLANPIEGFAVYPSVDSVAEFKVQTNSYSAEFGRSGSGIINLIYKSGTNQFHGSAFEFLRNSDLDANGFIANRNGTKLANFKRNQFGGSLGGPVDIPRVYKGKDRSFFFFAYEGLRQGSASNLNNTVPSVAQRTGDFSHTLNASGQLITIYDPTTTVAQGTGYVRSPFAGNIIPANRIDTVARNAIKYYPLPNLPGSLYTATNNYFIAGSAVTDSNTIDAKVDENINDRNRFFVRYSRYTLHQPFTPFLPKDIILAQNGANNNDQASNSAAVDYTWVTSPTNLFDFRIGFARTKLNYASVSLGFNPTQLGLPSIIAANADHLLFPGFAPANFYTLGQPGAGATRAPGFSTFLLGVENTRILGGHTLRFGWEGRLLQVTDTESGSSTGSFTFTNAITQGPNPNAATSIAGNSIASMLLGIGSGQMTINSRDGAEQSKYFGAFVQDDWKVARRLTLNLGLRYDLDLPATERYNRMEVFDPDIPSPLNTLPGLSGLKGGVVFAGINGRDRRYLPPQWANFGPRFGFAYQIASHTVLRGGYGIFFAPSYFAASAPNGSQGYSASTEYTGSANGLTPSLYLSNPFPNGINKPAGNSQGLLTGLGSTFQNPQAGDNRVPYTENWDFDVQRELPGNVLVDASYVGSHGVHINKGGSDFNVNQLTPQSIALGTKLQQSVANPFFGVIKTGPESTATVPMAYLMQPFPQYTGMDTIYPTLGYTLYHSFQLKVEKRFSHGLSVLVSFTGQKLIDDYSIISNVGNNTGGIQNIYDDRQQRAVSSNDISRRLVTSGIYELPFGRGKMLGKRWNRATDALLGGWQVNGIATKQTGFPISVTAANTCTNCGIGTLRPNNNGQSAALSGPISLRLTRYFNTSVFSQPAAFTFGNVGRTLPNVRGPGTQNIDFSLFKNFHPMERLRVQFRAEAFNALNQVVFGMPAVGLSSLNFGQITTQANGSRAIQFGLKLLF